ncbi:MAG: hypothetical protein ACRDP6_11475 [Actinoallomurus sp.]
MADKPKKDDEKTPATDDKGTQVQPDGMNPHGMNPHAEPEESEKEDEKD